MRLIRCDRCKDEYDPHDTRERIEITLIKNIIFGGTRTVKYEICQKCLDDLKDNWLENREYKDTDEEGENNERSK